MGAPGPLTKYLIKIYETIGSWFGFMPGNAANKHAFQQLNQIAPLSTTQNSPFTTDVGEVPSAFIFREAILNRNERIGGYKFTLGQKLKARLLTNRPQIRRAYDNMMISSLASMGISSLLGGRFALIQVSLESLNNARIEAFSNQNVVIMIAVTQASEINLAEVLANLQRLRNLGVKYGWVLDRSYPELAQFMPLAEIVEIESLALDGIELKTMCRKLHAIKGGPKLIASQLQTADEFNLCYHSGFDFFMGSFISSRENWNPAKSKINKLRVFEVLNMIRAEKDFSTIAERLRTEPVLTFRLLRYINSPVIGLGKKIDAIEQGLMVLGRDRFYRWLSLLLFDFDQPGYQMRVMSEQALTRGRFMELLAGHGKVSERAEWLFITGLFSMLDMIIGQPLKKILNQILLPESVLSALDGKPGATHNVLLLAIAIDAGDSEKIGALATECGLNIPVVSRAVFEAMTWSEQLVASIAE